MNVPFGVASASSFDRLRIASSLPVAKRIGCVGGCSTSGSASPGRMPSVDELLDAEDQHGVAVDEVRRAKAALEAGKIAEARTLLQGSIATAVAALAPATGDETGTTVVLGPLPPRGPLTGWYWGLLLLSALAILLGTVLAILFRPRDSVRELRHTLSPPPGCLAEPIRMAPTRSGP
jgi:hypothetical protein